MAVTPDSTSVGSSSTPTSPRGIGDTPRMPSIEPTVQKPGSALRPGGNRWGDRIFGSVAVAAGATIIGAIALMGLFLLIRAVPSLEANHANFITSSEFVTSDETNMRFGIAGLFQVTVLSSVFALLIAVPIAVGIATFLTNYAPKRLARPCGILVDLLAAVPSIVFGLWGIFVLAPWLEPVQTFPQRQPRLVPPLRGRQRLPGRRRHDLHRGSRAGRHDPADHHFGVAGSVQPDAARAMSRPPRRWVPRNGKSSGSRSTRTAAAA